MSRAYGWDSSGQIIEEEAAVLRRIAADLVDGRSFSSIVAQLNADQVPTATGSEWAITSLTRRLRNPRMIGKREVDGILVDHPKVEGILDVASWEHIVDLLSDTDRQKHTRKSARKHLLTGFCRCSVCGSPAYPGSSGVIRGCDHVQIFTDVAEQEITEQLLARITSPAWLTAVGDLIDRDPAHYREVIGMADDRIVTLAETFGGGHGVDETALAAGVAAAREVRDGAVSTLALIEATKTLPALTDEAVVRWWADEDTPVEDRRTVLGSVVDHVEILPLKASSDRERLVVHWL